ncbi:putative endoglucanase [compost metagenome]
MFPKSYLYNRNEPKLYPFEGSVEKGWNYSVFNPAFFEHLEQRIADLGRLGIEADLILFHPYDRWGFSEMNKEADDLYLRYIVARLSAFRHVWWSLANEFDLMWAKTSEDWERYAQIITENDPYGHLLSNHNWLAFYDHSKPWLTHCSLQRIDVYKTSEAALEWRERWDKPIVIDECAYEGDIDQGWGNISGEEMVRRFWEGTIRGGYVGHGETYLNDEEVLWWSKGGKLVGDSPSRIGFLRRLVEEAPGQRWEPLRSDWDLPCAGIQDEYYVYYFGFNQPKFRIFQMKPGIKYKVDIIDTWNMTIDESIGIHEGTFRVELPGRLYMAVRLTRVE